jgi:OmpA-OmpF porin, OOP family
MKTINRYFVVIIIFAVTMSLAFNIAHSQVAAVSAVTGKMINRITKEPVGVKFHVYDISGKRVNARAMNSNASSGYYYITSLKPGSIYYIHIEEDNYMKEVFEVMIPDTDKYNEISRDFQVSPKEIGTKIPIAVPPFELRKSRLRWGADEILDEYAMTMMKNPDVIFEILSYPESEDDKEANKQLTSDRANNLKDYFISKGVPPERITATGKPLPDPRNPPPAEKQAKGKRYIGPTYIYVAEIKR